MTSDVPPQTADTLRAPLREVRVETPSSRLIRLDISGTRFDFEAGQAALIGAAESADRCDIDAAEVGVSAKRLNISSGSRVTVKGRLATPGTVKLQIQRRGRWVTLDRDRTGSAGRYVLRKRVSGAMSTRARVRTGAGVK